MPELSYTEGLKDFFGSGYNDNSSCKYSSVNSKNKVERPWKLISNDLLEIEMIWECEDPKIHGYRIIQMSCSKQRYMILDEYINLKKLHI